MWRRTIQQKNTDRGRAASRKLMLKENGRFPILETTSNENGDVVIVTGDNNGSFVRYTFTE